MAELSFYINNVLAPPPNGWQGLDLELAWENNSPDASIKTTNFEWLGEDAKTLYTWKQNGLLIGPGIYEGIPFRIEACDGVIAFDGCIDMTTEETTFTCDIIKASCIETNRIQNVANKVDGFSFAYLKSLGSFGTGAFATTFTNADYLNIPYVISTIPDWLQVAILTTTFVSMIKLIKDSIETTVGYIQSAASSYPIVWEMAMFSALATASIAYSLFLTALMVNLLLMLINEIVQPIKFKYAMRIRTLFEKACAYLDLGFSSTILQGTYKNAVIMPRKSAYYTNPNYNDSFLGAIFSGSYIQRKVYNEVYNPNAYGYYEGTFGQLIREMEDVFNAKVVVRNNIFYFERWDYWNNLSSMTMPNQSSEAPFQDPFGTNAHEITANYYLSWTQDSTDENTLDQYDGMSCEMTMRPIVTINPKNNLLKGLTEKKLNYALAKPKTKLTTPERVINKLLHDLSGPYSVMTFWDNTFAIHAAPSLPPDTTMTNRIGAMLLSSDFTSLQKFFIVEDNPVSFNGVPGYRIASNNNQSNHEGLADAFYLMKNYHSASWGVNKLTSPTTYPNQYSTYKDKEIPLCCLDFNTLRNNNIITSYDGKPGRVDSVRWNPHTETAKLDFRVQEVFTKNLTQNIIIDGLA